MSRKVVGIIIMVVGVIAIVVSLGADMLGLGGAAGIGWKQIAGTVVGFLLVASGLWWGYRRAVVKK